MIHELVLPRLQRFYEIYGFTEVEWLISASQLHLELLPDHDWQRKAAQNVFEGNLLMHIPALGVTGTVNIADLPTRKPEESNLEVSIRGPRDGFVEDLVTNVALIRKRIKSPSLAYDSLVVGERTQTRVGLMYVYDIADPKTIQDVKQRIQKITIDGIFSATQLEELIAPAKAWFPLMVYTGRPDFAVNCLLNGRFVLLVDGTPAALVAPANLTLLVKTPEDIHYTALSSTFGQSLRLLGLVVSLMLPAFWVSLLAYHHDHIPFYLLATLTTNRLGIPLSVTIEMFLALLFLEILREAGVRLPSAVGSTLTVVGGLILGDAAIRAGILSPGIVVIGALTHVFGATLTNQALSGTVSILRFMFFCFAALFGLYGFFSRYFYLAGSLVDTLLFRCSLFGSIVSSFSRTCRMRCSDCLGCGRGGVQRCSICSMIRVVKEKIRSEGIEAIYCGDGTVDHHHRLLEHPGSPGHQLCNGHWGRLQRRKMHHVCADAGFFQCSQVGRSAKTVGSACMGRERNREIVYGSS